jgi:hypothetical protein
MKHLHELEQAQQAGYRREECQRITQGPASSCPQGFFVFQAFLADSSMLFSDQEKLRAGKTP